MVCSGGNRNVKFGERRMRPIFLSCVVGFFVSDALCAGESSNACLGREVTMTISDQVKNYLLVAQDKMNSGEYSDADAAFTAGLNAIGNKYHDPRVVDDSGQKLSLADDEISRGKTTRGLTIKERILEERLEMLLSSACRSAR
jgi:hypothetical protein